MFAAAPNRTASIIGVLTLMAPIVQASAAEAQVRNDVRNYYWPYQPPAQQRGYDGYDPPRYTCSESLYERQECRVDENGEQRCPVVTSRLDTTCQ